MQFSSFWAIGQEMKCFMPEFESTPNFAPQNTGICNNFLNYIPDEDHYSHTSIKTIKLNFHYFLTNDPLDPRNLTESTGFNMNDTWNTGYQFAKDLVDKCNVFVNQNAPSLIPPGNGLPNHPIRIKFEIYKDPNDSNDRGVYFHRFSDWTNPNSDYWYMLPNPSFNPNLPVSDSNVQYVHHNPIYIKNTYSVHKDEVIDIFFMDNPKLNDLGGVATGYGMITKAAFSGSDLFEGWNNGIQWHDNWAGTLIHEVGHILSLDHSYVNDGCTDTYESLEKCYQWPGAGGTLYDNNYMSYCPKPMSAFTPQQLGKIHYFLENKNPLYVCDFIKCETDSLQDITIQSGQNIIWNSTKHLIGNLIIESNATLTIKCDVFLKALGYIKVKEKGHLIIDGGRVTSECDNKLWYGIFVLGNEATKQTTIEQGIIETKNDAVIENAIIGIRTGDFYYNQNDLSWPTFSGKTGGIIQSKNTLFRNNRKSIEFMKYHNILPPPYNIEVDNVSYFIGCNFINDDYLKGYNYGIANQWGTEFVTAWDVQGVRFTNCTFKDEISANFTPDLIFKTTAIGSYGAKYYIDNCTFKNLYAGVWAESTLDPMDYIDIKNSTFDNVHLNLTSINQYGDKIAGNTIKNQPASNFFNLANQLIYSWGIYTKGSTQFKIYDNNISSANPIGGISTTPMGLMYQLDNNIGIVNSDTWFEDCVVAENRIENQTVSVQTEDNNYNLFYTCNEHKGNQLSWYVNPASPWGFLNNQGTANGDSQNQFFDGCFNQSTKNQIRSDLNTIFIYSDDINNLWKPDSNCVTSNVVLSFVPLSGSPISCNQNILVLDTTGNGKITIDNIDLTGFNNYQKQTILLNLAAYHRGQGEIGKVISALEMLNSTEAAKLLVSLCYSLNENAKATEWLNKLSVPSLLQQDELNLASNATYPTEAFTQDRLDFISLFQNLIQSQAAGRTIYSLTETELLSLYSLSEHDTRSGLMAKGLLSFVNRNVRKMSPEVPVQNSNRTSAEAYNSTVDEYTIYPNPFYNEITLKRNSGMPAIFVIRDIIGNKIAEYKLVENEFEKSFSTENWNIGSYFGTLYAVGQQNHTFRILKLK